MASTSEELFAAIDDGDLARVTGLLEDDPSLATARDPQGVSALMRARYRFDRGLIEALQSRVEQLDLFERVINLVRQHAPDAAIAFNATPSDTYEAAARWID